MEDGAPSHRAKLTKEYIMFNHMKKVHVALQQAGPFTAAVGPEKKMHCGPPPGQFSSHDGPLNDQLGPQITKQGP